MRIKFTCRLGRTLLLITSMLCMSNMSHFTDPAIGANVTFSSCTAGTVLASSNTGQASYTFTSSDCDGNGFTAICNATGASGTNVCRVIIGSSASINVLRFDRTNIAVSVTNAQLKSTSGVRFQLTNLKIFPLNGGNQTITVKAFAAGVAVPGSTITINYVMSTPIHGTTLTAADFGSNYNSIDEIQASTTAVTGLTMTDIQTAPAIALPVTLVNFTGRPQGHSVVLSWTTAQEIDNAYFEVDRKAGDSNWTDIGKVTGHGTTALPENYSFTDNTPASGTNFYRLKQVGLDGNTVYSPIIAVETTNSATATLTLFPNPVQGILNLAIQHDRQETAIITIRDFSGATVLRTTRTLTNGPNSLAIDRLQTLPQGAYIVNIVTPTTQYTEKFIKGH